jgi:hypothetical protein
MNRLNGLLATSETGLSSSPSQGLGRRPEPWEAPQSPFSTSTCPGADARPFRLQCPAILSGRSSERILLKPAQPLCHL